MPADDSSKRVLELCDRALALAAEERAKFLGEACEGDTRLRASVDSVLIAVNQAGSFLEADDDARVEPANLVGTRVGQYEIIDTLGKGGMGSVYLAERREEEFTQRVAIKFVHSHMLARELAERFNAERRILAALNHPFIAALIDSGTSDQGVPYIVLEYVDGIPIDEYCDQHELDIEQRIQLVQKVAMAVQAAHQNLVVHRDLKPSNVLITSDGIPKLLDFGIAKLMQSGDSSEHGNTTVFGRQAMTPDYASPEQILENKVTTASDVYSLGILAYQLLAGERPYSIPTSSHSELVKSVESLTVPPASSRLDSMASGERVEKIADSRSTTPNRLRRKLVGDLDNILTKALHRDSNQRYSSIAGFSADLQRYLDDLPVEARPDSVGYRLSRFVARHRVGVAASTALALSLIAGLAGTAWAYLQAEEARAEASERFGQVRKLANTMMFDVFSEIENVPGTKTARQMLAATAQEYLETLSETENVPADIKLDAAHGYARLAAIFDDQAVPDPTFRERAKEAADNALQLFEELTESNVVSIEAYRGLAKLRSDRSNANLYNLNDAVKSREEIELALTAYDGALTMTPDDPELIAEVITARVRLADTYKWQDDYAPAEALMDELLADSDAARAKFPESHDVLKAAGDAQFLRGEIRSFDDRMEEAIDDYEKALSLYEPISRVSGERNPVRQAQTIASWSLGNALINMEKPAEAEPHYRHAMQLTEVRFVRDPDDRNAQRTYQILRGSLASALVRTGKEDEAIDLIVAVSEWFELQAAADPDTPGTHRSVAVGYHEAANIYEAAGEDAEACRWYEKTLSAWEKIDQTFGISEFDAEQPEILKGILDEC